MADIEYGLKEPFDIDSGELEGLSPQDIFCLGYEWRQMEDLLETGDAVEPRPLHAGNRERVQRMCIRRGRKCKIVPTVEGWCEIQVEGT